MATFQVGYSGKAECDATEVNIEGWEFNPECDLQETTHSGSSGYKTYVAGLKGATGVIRATWDSDAVPTDDPPDLNVGQSIAMKLYIGTSGSVYINIATAYIASRPIVSEVQGKVTYTVNFTVSGSWSYVTS